MLLTGAILTGGAVILGTQINRARQAPRTSLIDRLVNKQNNIATTRSPMFSSLQPQTIVIGGLLIGGGALLLASVTGFTPVALTNSIVTVLLTSNYSPLLFLVAKTLRPLIFLPDALMCIAGGLLFGPWWGTIYSLIGEATSAMLAYGIGYYARSGDLDIISVIKRKSEKTAHLVQHYSQKMQENPFESMVMLRGLFLQFDVASYLAGYLNLAWRPYLLGTILGTAPGTVASAFLGASLQVKSIQGGLSLNPITLAASGFMMIGCLGMARYFKQRQEHFLSEE